MVEKLNLASKALITCPALKWVFLLLLFLTSIQLLMVNPHVLLESALSRVPLIATLEGANKWLFPLMRKLMSV